MDKREPKDQAGISEGRRITFYIGNAVMVIGVILFFSFFFSIAMTIMNSHDGFNRIEHRMGWAAMRLFTGFILIVVGGSVRMIGAMGLAGSGVVLDPAQARRDVQPWARMAGGLANDAVNEIDVVKEVAHNLADHDEPVREIIKVRCAHCSALNDEDARFCNQCGQAMK